MEDLLLIAVLLFFFVILYPLFRGADRNFRIAAFLLMLDICLFICVASGPAYGIISFLFGLTIGFGAAVGIQAIHGLFLRIPLDRESIPCSIDDYPEYSRKVIREATKELEALAFMYLGDLKVSIFMRNKERMIFTRFLQDHARQTWIELGVLSAPRLIMRTIRTMRTDGYLVKTQDHPFRLPVEVQTSGSIKSVSKRTSYKELFTSHRKQVETAPGSTVVVEDPSRESDALHRLVYQQLLEKGYYSKVSNGFMKPTMKMALFLTIQAFANWFR